MRRLLYWIGLSLMATLILIPDVLATPQMLAEVAIAQEQKPPADKNKEEKKALKVREEQKIEQKVEEPAQGVREEQKAEREEKEAQKGKGGIGCSPL